MLCAIRRLRESEKLALDAIRTRLNALSAPELEALATRDVPPGKLAEALGVRPTPPVIAPAPASVDHIAREAPRWRRVELALGLELHLREDASARVLDMARGVREWCAAFATRVG